ncbi:MAG: hypothetical protein ABI542_10480 [Gemmatimonadota bacterium]
MKQTYPLEIGFLVLVIVVSLVGFSSLYGGDTGGPNGYQYLHIITNLAWLALLLCQLVLISQRRFQRHRTIGTAIFVAGPILLASLTLLTVHSAAKDAVLGRPDVLVVQNVMFTLQIALLVFLAFALRRNRKVHGALLLGTALMFLVIALFFSFIAYVPRYQIEGPETFYRFGEAAQMSALIGGIIGLLFFLKDWRSGWPWIMVTAFVFLDGYLQVTVDQAGRTVSLTQTVASIGRLRAFALGLIGFLALLGVAWRVGAPKRAKRVVDRI